MMKVKVRIMNEFYEEVRVETIIMEKATWRRYCESTISTRVAIPYFYKISYDVFDKVMIEAEEV